MKNLRPGIVDLLKKGSCTPRISDLASKLHSKSTTVHYNVKQMERDGTIKSYKAVFDYNKIDEGFCTYVLISLGKQEYKSPEAVARELAKYDNIESVDIVTGQWEIIIKVRAKDIAEYYEFAKKVLSLHGIEKTHTLNSMHQVKTEFMTIG